MAGKLAAEDLGVRFPSLPLDGAAVPFHRPSPRYYWRTAVINSFGH